MRKIYILTLFLFTTYSVLCIDSRNEMQSLILSLSKSAKAKNPLFLILLQNPKMVLNSENSEIVSMISGVTIEEYFYGYPNLGDISSNALKDEFTTTIQIMKDREKKILFIDYLHPSQLETYQLMIKSISYPGALFYPTFSKKLNAIDNENVQPHKINSFNEISSFTYFINPEKFSSKESYFAALKRCNANLIVIDPDFDGVALSKNELSYLLTNNVGEKRYIFSYLSIGEAEKYRKYWKSEWESEPPSWILDENPNWKGNYGVKYWSQEWYAIVENELLQIESVGFSGVVFDTLDSYEFFQGG